MNVLAGIVVGNEVILCQHVESLTYTELRKRLLPYSERDLGLVRTSHTHGRWVSSENKFGPDANLVLLYSKLHKT